jgi:hypothetical protein
MRNEDTLLTHTSTRTACSGKDAHLLRIFGTSLKKFDRSTSFLVADHEILYENMCARIAWQIGRPSPPKKKKLPRNLICKKLFGPADFYDSQEWYPHEILQQALQLQQVDRNNSVDQRYVDGTSTRGDTHKFLLAQTVLQQRVPNVSTPKENSNCGKKYLKTVDIISVHRQLKPEQHIIDYDDGNSCGHPVFGAEEPSSAEVPTRK